MGDTGRHPHGAGGRHDPCARVGLDEKHAGGRVDELMPVVRVPVELGSVGVANGVGAHEHLPVVGRRVFDTICLDDESLPQPDARTLVGMAHNIVHFAIHADDVERARRFYEAVFDWRFEAWGPPGFYNVITGDDERPGIFGALHAREEPLSGTGTRGFTNTVAVDDIAAIREKVVANGGTITYEEIEIPSVGTLTQFLDPEGNELAAMKYEMPMFGA